MIIAPASSWRGILVWEFDTMSKPLEGIKVIEIAQEIQGPFAGLFLADLVRKLPRSRIERPAILAAGCWPA